MLLSQSLLAHQSFALDKYSLPRREPLPTHGTYLNGDLYQLEIVRDRLYYYFPPGTSILSLPLVAVVNLFGVSTAHADGTFNLQGERTIQSAVAAVLMATLAAVFFFTSRLLLPPLWSVIIALGGALGTQVWSTASRGMWSHTWGALLLGVVILLVLAHETGARRFHPVLLASLLAWMYFVRPTSSIFIVAVSMYIFLQHRWAFLRYVITGAAWLAGFVAFSWYYYGQWLPAYYRTDRLNFEHFWTAFAGNLVSPSRGLFVYSPVVLFIGYLLLRYRREIAFPRLVWLASLASIIYLAACSAFTPWDGGFCYGPRYSTELVPWFVLLAVFGITAMQKWRLTHPAGSNASRWNAGLAAGVLLLLWSVFVHGRGAISVDTERWNELPERAGAQPAKVWDWRYPQFLAGWVRPPLPEHFPSAESRIEFAQESSHQYLYDGWSGNEAAYRWTDGSEAAVVFRSDGSADADLEMKLAPFLVPGRLETQRVILSLNGRELKTLVLRENAAREYSLRLPRESLRRENVLTFGLPDAASPSSLDVHDDPRELGIAMHWLEIRARGGNTVPPW